MLKLNRSRLSQKRQSRRLGMGSFSEEPKQAMGRPKYVRQQTFKEKLKEDNLGNEIRKETDTKK